MSLLDTSDMSELLAKDVFNNLTPKEQERLNTNVLIQKHFDEVQQYLKEKYPEEFI